MQTPVASYFITLLAAVTLFAGCTPPGPRALLSGKRLLEHGKYLQAVEQLKLATSLLPTNAQAFNYLGLACHNAGLPVDAEKAYRRALALDHDLMEAHYNLGCLLLAQNRPEAAKTQLITYALRRGNSPEGFLKLGTAQLRCRDLPAAEKSFSDALRLSPQNPEALMAMAMVRLQRGRPAEAAQCLTDVLKRQPAYPPALLNLAILYHQHLRDPQSALKRYREYATLKPPPENLAPVKTIIQQLEQELARPATATLAQARTPLPTAKPQPPPSPAPASTAGSPRPPPVKTAAVIKPEPKPEIPIPAPRPAPATNPPKPALAPAPSTPLEVVKLPAEPVIKPAQDVQTAPLKAPLPVEQPLTVTASPKAAETSEAKPLKRSFFQRVNPLNLLGRDDSPSLRTTPLPPANSAPKAQPAKPEFGPETVGSTALPKAEPGQPAAGWYAYKSPARPASGNRKEAERAFAQGVQAQQARRLPEALQAYRQATQLDPAFFDAYYNLGLAASDLGNMRSALAAYEQALAIRPESVDARYNFALLLKQGNYLLDAANELEKILAIYPNETRAHLALGNLYAQQLGQPAKARQHYLKVLEVEPRHPQAGNIRYWLADHPR